MSQATGPVVGLRVDVDTYRGTRDGVPRLLDCLDDHGLLATFFFTVGPDNMGRHLWRLLKPAFLLKMLRSNAPGLYGWDILLAGTAWPGRRIAENLGEVLRATADAGHEVGLHAWDHHAWQRRVEGMSAAEIERDLQRGMDALSEVLGAPVRCSAAAGWKCNDEVLRAKQTFNFLYNSDCRGESLFRPVVDGVVHAPQIPATLPTYDELIGWNGISDDNYNSHVLSLIRPERLNVLTIHAEVEGISRAQLFSDFLEIAAARGVTFVPLCELLAQAEDVPTGRVTCASLPGREGTLCQQVPGCAS